jgi:hypothetical protein
MEKYRGPVKESPHRLQAFTGWPTRWQLGAAAARDAGSVRRYTLAAHRGYTSSEPRSRPRRDALAAEAAIQEAVA